MRENRNSSNHKFVIKNWTDLKIGTKIGLGFGILIFLSLIIGALTTINMGRIQIETKYLANESLPSVNESFRIEKDWREVMFYMQAYDFYRDPYYLDRANQNLTKYNNSLNALIKLSDNSKKATIGKERLDNLGASVEAYSKILQQYKELETQNQKLFTEIGRGIEQIQESGNAGSAVGSNLVNAGFSLYMYVNKRMPNKLEAAERYLDRAANAGGLGSGTAGQVITDARQFIRGYKQARELELKRNEIENLLKVDIMALADVGLDQITEMTEKTNSIITQSRVVSDVILVILLVIGIILGYIISKSITSSIKAGLQLAQNISNGVLHRQREVVRKDEIGELMTALNRMNNQLKFIVEEISGGIQNIASASQKMNKNATELSEAATDQAATTEEISSSIQELHANFLQSADNAEETEKIALSAAGGIKDGFKATELASESLNDIIEKVGFIGDLAFQTNILALNAAVEAARAGDHGRGFAVVATEVKKLADSSKNAAELINKVSRETVVASDQAGLKLQKLVPEIEKTAQLVQGIRYASNEQEVGINQINNAIQQLNNIAQQNAYSSENMANNSQELSLLADKLKKTIEFFKIGS